MTAKILVIDDDPNLAEMLARKLEHRGYHILVEHGGKEGLKSAFTNQPDLIILDIMMPEMDGFEVCTRIRKMSNVPILMLTGKTTDKDVIRGLDSGADGYVKKPYNLKELEARVKTLLKHRIQIHKKYDDGVLKINLETGLVFRKGNLINLTPTEFNLLKYLVERKGQIIPREAILRDVWGEAYKDDYPFLANYIHYLRKKIEDDPSSPVYIRTDRGKGYKFSPQ